LIKKDALNDDMIYIGSTTNIIKRKQSHYDMYNKNSNIKVYNYIYNNGGFSEWELVVIDEVEVPFKYCAERYELENNYIKKYDAINKLNMRYSRWDKTGKEYRKENTDKIKEYLKNNSEKIKKQVKIYYENNYENIINYAKDYREKNYEKINEKINCDMCDCLINKRGIKRHQKTKKCINNLK
jgi:hypothetical protein